MKELTASQLTVICCAAVSILIALLALAGWATGIDWLFRLPNSPAMFPATAVTFIMASTSLLLQIRRPGRSVRASVPLALVVVGVGLISGLLRGLNWAPQPLTLSVYGKVTYGNIPGSVTSALFIALGISLGLMRSRRYIVLAQIIAVGILLFSMLVLLTYLSRGAFLQELLPGRGGIAARTALSFVLLSGGMLYLRPHEGIVAGLSRSATGRSMVRELLMPAVLAPILLGILLTGAIRVTTLGFDDTFMIWLIVWGTITFLVIVIWRFAYRLSEQESRRRLAEKERNEAMEALRLADERKNVFLATLAHELKNPLSAIGTGASLLTMVRTSDPDQVRRTADLISRQVNQMAHLVDDLMDVSRVIAGIIVLDKQRLDVRQVISDALEQVHPLFEAKGHSLRADLPAESMLVEGDRNRLLQVFANLLSNSARYTPDRGNVFIQAVVLDGRVVVSVRDDGIGIEPDLLPELFDLFKQAKRNSDRSQGGLGLGLALVKSLVELHGGEVTAHSEGLGKGSVFTVVLPEIGKNPAK